MTKRGARRLQRGCVWNPKTGIAKFCVYLKGSQKKRRLTVWCGSDEEARDKFNVFRKKWKRADPSKEPIPTLRKFYDEHFDEIAAGLKPSTVRGYRHVLEGRLLEVFGNKRLDAISSGAVNLYQKCLIKEGLASASVNNYVNVLKAIVGKAVEWELIPESPFRRPVRALKVKPPTNELSPTERAAFLAAFDDRGGFDKYLAQTMPRGKVRDIERGSAGDPFSGKRKHGAGIKPGSPAADAYFGRLRAMKPFFVCLLTTGLRLTDARLLRWSEVDLEMNLISLTTRKRDIDVTLPITSELRPLLLECRRRTIISEFVFSETGRPLSLSRIRRAFRIAKALSGIIRRFRMHDLRHTMASGLVTEGLTLAQVATLLAHGDYRSSARYARAGAIETAEAARDALEAAASRRR